MRSLLRTGSMVVLLGSILGGCTPEPDPDPDNMQRPQGHISTAASGSIEGFEMERQEILAELKELRAEINEELKRYEERSVTMNMDAEEQELNQQIIKDLQQQRTLMDRQIEKVERAAVSEWYDLRSDSETAAEQAKLFEKRLNAEGPAAIDPSE